MGSAPEHGRPHGDEAIRAIAASIATHPAIARFDGSALVEPAAAARLLAAFRELVFPGFHSVAHAAAHDDAETFAAERVPALRAALVQGIAASARAEGRADAGAEAIADLVIAEVPAMRAALAEDVDAAYRGDPAARSRAEVVLCYPGILALTAHRFANALWRHGVIVLARMVAEIAHSATGIDIHPGATIGRGVFIDHGTGVVIGETCAIGAGCRIYQGVTLGAKKFERDADGSLRKGSKRHPTLGERVTVYAGATILGGDTVIGDGSVVAGGVFVTQSVPAGHLVAAQKAQVRVLPHGEDPA
jgi:serine O-acetyltransferase